MSKRNLYLDNIPVDEAISRFLDALSLRTGSKTESVSVIDSLDRVTSEAVFALVNSPLYDSAAMDGIAVISKSTRGASESRPLQLGMDDYIPIDTGDPVKPPFDAVIMAEVVQEAEAGGAIIRSAAAPWQHVRPVGEDITQGEMILPNGHRIRPVDIGVLLSAGITDILVKKMPTVAIIPTGDELVDIMENDSIALKEGDIIESNSRMLEALVKKSGGLPIRFMPVKDDFGAIKEVLQEALKKYDMILFIAGTSAGRGDYTSRALRELGEVVLHGVAVKPGKPVILAVASEKPVIGIPGYPVSAYLTYENFVSPVLSMLSGSKEAGFPIAKATLTRRLVSSLKHREYVRVKIGRIGSKLVATPLSRGAGAAMSLVRADGFCIIPRDTEGFEAGTEVGVALSRSLEELEDTLVSIGSHDLIMDILADMLPGLSGISLSSMHVGSMGGLMALKNGEAHIAPIHLLDEMTGTYNTVAVSTILKGREISIIRGVGRIQGIIVKKGNPLGIKRIADLAKGRYINRQRGAGTRLLFDVLLKEAGIEPSAISGYSREVPTHMAVASAVAGGNADAGIGIMSAASAMGLDFIPIGTEGYDYAVPMEFLDSRHVKAFIEALQNPAFHKRLDDLGGYTYDDIGNIVDNS